MTVYTLAVTFVLGVPITAAIGLAFGWTFHRMLVTYAISLVVSMLFDVVVAAFENR